MDNNLNENNSNFLNNLKHRIKNLFKHKETKYLMAPGQTLQLPGKMPYRTFSGFFSKIGSTIFKVVNKPRKFIEASKIKNPPEIYSTSLKLLEKEKQPTPKISLLNEGNINERKIIPVSVSEVAQTIPNKAKTPPSDLLKTNSLVFSNTSNQQKTFKPENNSNQEISDSKSKNSDSQTLIQPNITDNDEIER